MKKFQNKGFTLIELLLYMLIFPFLLLVISNIFGSIVDAQLESKSYSSVDLDGRFVLTKLAYDFQSADSADYLNNQIILPATQSSDTTLKIKVKSVTYTYSASTSGRIQLNNPALYDITSSDSSVSALLFQRIGAGDNRDTVRVSFRLTSKINRKSGADFRDFQSTFSMP